MTIYRYPYPRTSRGRLLKDYLVERRDALRAAVRATEPDLLADVSRTEELVASLVEQFELALLELGDTSVSDQVGEAVWETDDPRELGPGQRTRRILVDVYEAFIPVAGDAHLLDLWPHGGSFVEPDERIRYERQSGAIVIPAWRRRGEDDRGGQTKRYLRQQEEYVRALVAATNEAVKEWNVDLPGQVRERVEYQRAQHAKRHAVKRELGFPVAARQPKPVPYRISRTQRPRRTLVRLEGGDYPLLAAEDFDAVLSVIRRWADYIPEHPEVVAGKDEEALRSDLLHDLNTTFSSGTAETFSKLGKTDIRLVVATATDTGIGDQLFKAECKIWDGPKSAAEATTQLFDRYLTFRETRTAIVLFVTNRSDLAGVHAKAVSRVLEEFAGTEAGEVAGWPIVRVPHPDDPGIEIDLAVVVVDATPPRS